MTVSDLIAQLTRLQKQLGSRAPVKIGRAFGSLENPFDSFDVRNPMDTKEIYLVPSDRWHKDDLRTFAQRESMR